MKITFFLKGLVDLEKEISKCEKKLDLARLNLQKIVKIESQPEYEETVPANVRTANDDKVWSILLVFLISLTIVEYFF